MTVGKKCISIKKVYIRASILRYFFLYSSICDWGRQGKEDKAEHSPLSLNQIKYKVREYKNDNIYGHFFNCIFCPLF